MSRHLVALTSEYQSFDKGKLFKHGMLVFSGFVVEIMDKWFWVTAGHCLKLLDSQMPDGLMKLFRTEFMDCFGPGDTVLNGIPFTYEPGCGFYVDNESHALDFGVIPLSDLYRQNMLANGVVAISRDHWQKQENLDWTEYKILGFPEHEHIAEVNASGLIDAQVRPVMISIDRIAKEDIENPPEGLWFTGRIPSDVTIPSLKGMSGGPIYGFRKSNSGQWTYHIVALQSWWRPESRIIFGCSLPLFAEVIHHSLEARHGPKGA
jgi:hypothetical protein